MMEGDTRTRVVILAGSYRIKGEIELVPGARITDYMLDAKEFFAVTKAEVWDLEGRKIFSAPFLDVSRDQVVVVAPD
ncbi:MAG TPA: hypothetical protein VLC73_14450 [Burkholderiales bacterium]|jgi:hypothetical protein|nr:hypothetical protein [Burkholderiales bacterium]